jgi:hypothetical protein
MTSRHHAPWFHVPVRILLVTLLLTMMAFALSLMLGIFGTVIGAVLRGLHPNMTYAYRHVAVPLAAATGAIVLITMTVLEIRRYRQEKALASIAQASTLQAG